MRFGSVFYYLANGGIGITNGEMSKEDQRIAQGAVSTFGNSLLVECRSSKIDPRKIPVLSADSLTIIIDKFSGAAHFVFVRYNGAPAVILIDNPIEGATRDMFESLAKREAGEHIYSFSLPLGEIRYGSEQQRVMIINHIVESYLAPIRSTLDQGAIFNILFLAANPFQTTRLDLEEEIRSIQAELRGTKFREKISFTPHHAVRPDDLVRLMRAEKPHAVHFSGHGEKGGIVLRNDAAGVVLVEGDALARLFDQRGVELVLLNSCFSEAQAIPLSKSVGVVIGTTHPVGDDAARRFSAAFYRTLGDGNTVGEAFRDGGDAVNLHGLKDVFRIRGDIDKTLVH